MSVHMGRFAHVRSVSDNKDEMYINTHRRPHIVCQSGWPPRELSRWQQCKEAIDIIVSPAILSISVKYAYQNK